MICVYYGIGGLFYFIFVLFYVCLFVISGFNVIGPHFVLYHVALRIFDLASQRLAGEHLLILISDPYTGFDSSFSSFLCLFLVIHSRIYFDNYS